MCNFSVDPFTVDNLTLPTAEHHYVYKKCEKANKPELLQSVIKAPNARSAKNIGNQIPDDELVNCGWHDAKLCIMNDILTEKVIQVERFRSDLLETGNTPIVECTSDTFWASGLNEQLTKTTLPTKYRGKNMLGALLEKMRDLARDRTSVNVHKGSGPASEMSTTVNTSSLVSPSRVLNNP